MPKLRGKDLSSLYPSPKSYEELEANRQARRLARQPRHVETKIATWAVAGIITILITYYLALYLVGHNLTSAGAVLFGVSTSILLGLIMVAIIFYLYSLISNLATKVLLSPTVLLRIVIFVAMLTCVVLVILTQYQYSNLLIVMLILLLDFLVIYLTTKFILQKQNPQ